MTVDTFWTWTIIMADGQLFHVHKPISLPDLLRRFETAGHNHHEIEAIIRH